MTGAELKRLRSELINPETGKPGMSALQMGRLLEYGGSNAAARSCYYNLARSEKPIPRLREMILNQKLNNGEGK